VAVDPGLLPRPFDEGWLFSLGDSPGAESPRFDDSGWRPVDLPHDWSSETRGGGPLHDRDTPEGASVGYLRGGTGWYRKHFVVGPGDAGRELDIVFDGVQQDCDVWLNGTLLGSHEGGQSPFEFGECSASVMLGTWRHHAGRFTLNSLNLLGNLGHPAADRLLLNLIAHARATVAPLQALPGGYEAELDALGIR